METETSNYEATAASLSESVPDPAVRSAVKKLLIQSPAFRQLSRDEQVEIAKNTVKVANFIATGGGVMAGVPMDVEVNQYANVPPTPELAASLASPAPPGRTPLSNRKQGQPAGQQQQQQPKQTVTQEGVQDFGNLVQTVDFPKFCASLVDGVFNAIVTSSIKQMQAYAELVKNVSKSVDQYMRDNVTENNARDYLAGRYPDHLEVDITGDKPKLKPKQGADEDNMPDFFKDLGLSAPVSNLDDDTVETVLVPAARQRIAMDRQQLLATMVMMGINRLVVTDGHIEAKVLFQLDTESIRKSKRTTTADWKTDYSRNRGTGYNVDATSQYSDDNRQANSTANWYSHNDENYSSNFKVQTVQDTDSSDKIKMHAELGGQVRLNFKSDYFPLEKMADVLSIDQIKGKTMAGTSQQPAASSGGGAPNAGGTRTAPQPGSTTPPAPTPPPAAR